MSLINTQRLVLATGNEGKVREFALMLAPLGVQILSAKGLELKMPEEGKGSEGATLMSNARLKAESLCAQSGLSALADDSGLFIEALGGLPGVDTSTYGGPDKLLAAMQGFTLQSQRKAYFSCVLAYASPQAETLFFGGRDDGFIAPQRMGEGGFGYDSVFIQEGDTFSNAKRIDLYGLEAIKSLGHRGKAVQSFLTWAAGHKD
jgi:XTP/dITP diphosphohydrolase